MRWLSRIFTDSQPPGPLNHSDGSIGTPKQFEAIWVWRFCCECPKVGCWDVECGQTGYQEFEWMILFWFQWRPSCGESRMILADSSICQNGRGITWFVDMLISGWCQATSPLFPSSKPWIPPKEAVHLTALQAREDHGELTWTFQKDPHDRARRGRGFIYPLGPQKWHFEDDFPFPKVGYVNSLEGMAELIEMLTGGFLFIRIIKQVMTSHKCDGSFVPLCCLILSPLQSLTCFFFTVLQFVSCFCHSIVSQKLFKKISQSLVTLVINVPKNGDRFHFLIGPFGCLPHPPKKSDSILS